MGLFVLDTDCLTLFLHGHEKLCQNAGSHDPAEIALSIVTVEETLTGWYAKIRKAKKDDQVIRAYTALQQAVEFCGRVRILPMDDDAMSRFRSLRSAHPRMGTNDLRIAAITLTHNAVLVTRNLRDFKAIAKLQTDDWTL